MAPEEEIKKKKGKNYHNKQWFSRQKRTYIFFKSTQLMIFYAFSEYFFK